MPSGVRSKLVQYKRKGRRADWAHFHLNATTPDPMQLQTAVPTLRGAEGRKDSVCKGSQGG